VSNLDWWQPLQAALSCMLNMMPREQRVATEEQLKLMAQAAENKGDPQGHSTFNGPRLGRLYR
jgi:hypothetical protein